MSVHVIVSSTPSYGRPAVARIDHFTPKDRRAMIPPSTVARIVISRPKQQDDDAGDHQDNAANLDWLDLLVEKHKG